MIGRYYQATPYEGNLYKPPVDVIGGALEMAQKQYDTNFAASQALKNKYIEARPQDRIRANELQNQYNQEIDKISAKYNGDWSAASKDLVALQSKMTKDFSPGGEAAAIQEKLSQETESLKRERERLAKGEVTSDQVQLLQEFYRNSPANTFDPNTGTYNQIQTIDLAKYVDRNKIAEEVLGKLKPRKKKVEIPAGKAPNGDYLYITQEVDWIDQNEAASAIQSNLFGNEQFMGYVNQTAQLAGQDPQGVLQSLVDDYAKNILPARTGVVGYSETSKTLEDWRSRKKVDLSNQMAMESYRQKNRKDLIDYKNKVDMESLTSDQPSLLAIQKGIGKSFDKLPTEYKAGSDNALLNFMIGPRPNAKVKVDELISNYEQGKPNKWKVNIPQLKSIKEANPGRSDAEIIEIYNNRNESGEAVQNYGEIHYDKYETTATQKEEAERLAPRLASGRVPIFRIDPDNGEVIELEGADRIQFYADMAQARKDKSPAFAALGKSRTANGKVPFGTVLADPNGGRYNYVVKEDRADIEWLQKNTLDKAFKFIADDSQQQSELFYMPINGQMVPTMGRKHYYNGEAIIKYHQAYRGADGRYYPGLDDEDIMQDRNPYTGELYALTPSEIEERLLPKDVVKSMYARKTGSSFKNELNEETP